MGQWFRTRSVQSSKRADPSAAVPADTGTGNCHRPCHQRLHVLGEQASKHTPHKQEREVTCNQWRLERCCSPFRGLDRLGMQKRTIVRAFCGQVSLKTPTTALSTLQVAPTRNRSYATGGRFGRMDWFERPV